MVLLDLSGELIVGDKTDEMKRKILQPISLAPGFSRVRSVISEETVSTVSTPGRKLLKQFPVLCARHHPAEAGC
jgi:hypothetical protein